MIMGLPGCDLLRFYSGQKLFIVGRVEYIAFSHFPVYALLLFLLLPLESLSLFYFYFQVANKSAEYRKISQIISKTPTFTLLSRITISIVSKVIVKVLSEIIVKSVIIEVIKITHQYHLLSLCIV